MLQNKKRIISLILMLTLLVSSLVVGAISASAADGEATATLTFDDTAKRTEFSTTKQVWGENGITLTNTKESSTSNVADYADPARFYKNSKIVITAPGNITKIEFDCNSGTYATALVNSIGDNATASSDKVTVTLDGTSNSNTYTITLSGGQVRMDGLTVTYAEASSEPEEPTCVHANTTTTTVDATCTVAGSTTVTCDDCGEVVSTESIDKIAHNYGEDNKCVICGTVDPQSVDYSGNYYIAAIRSSGNYWYMTNSLGTASTKRYQAEDSKLKELPQSIANGEDNKIFVIENNEDGTYSIYAKGTTENNYLGWTSGNSGILVAKESAIRFTITQNENGTYAIVDSTSTRNLSLNESSGSDYFAFYAGTQINDLSLIRVSVQPACEHTNTTETTVDAGCTVEGSKTTVCDDCGDTVSTEIIDALGHDEQEEIVGATCTESGSKTTTCSRCDYSNTEEIPATGHNYVDSVCSGCGMKKYVFSDLVTESEQYQEEKHVLDDSVTLHIVGCHINTQLRIYSSTTNNGVATFVSRKAISKIYLNAGHKTDTLLVYVSNDGTTWNDPVELSITSTSYNDYTLDLNGSYHYIKLDVKGTNQIRIANVSLMFDETHTYTSSVTAPTCEDAGYTTYTCNCGYSYVADNVEATGHDYSAVVTAPTCEDAGYTTYTCACGDSYVDDQVSALGHAWNGGVVTTNPSCTAEGVKTYTCGTCGATDTDSIEATGHDYSAVVTAPTCEDAGYTTYTCACGDSYVADNVDALGHAWNGGVVTTDPSCTAEGVRTYTCGTCGETYTESVHMTEHNWSEATCTTPSTCSGCGATNGDPLDHAWDGGVVTTDPSCTAEGVITYTCGTCGATDTDSIEATGHNIVDGDCPNCEVEFTLEEKLSGTGTVEIPAAGVTVSGYLHVGGDVTVVLNGDIKADGVILYNDNARFEGNGKLIIPEGRISLVGESDHMAIWDGTGYIFREVKDQAIGSATGEYSFNIVFRPSFGTIEENKTLLGSEIDEGLTFTIQIFNGASKVYEGMVGEDVVREAYANNKAISLSVKGADAGATYTVKLVITSKIGLTNTADLITVVMPAPADEENN